MSRRKLSLLSLAVVALFLLYYLYGGNTAPAGQPPLVRLNNSNLAAFKDAFNGSANSVRVLVLVSPT
jgi:hypothetical protein